MCGGPGERPKELVHGTGWREESKRGLDVKGGVVLMEQEEAQEGDKGTN
jgi:hypothetical protein